MSAYRDIGKINNVLNTQELVDEKKYTQVYKLTHDGEGKYLPHLNRAFISFSYGGKNIEDWNLIVTYADRYQKQLSADFEDLTTTYEVVEGQYYWGTYFRSNNINFTLSTDGMTQLELDDFISWFAPGQIKELILTEHPNRAIMARVSVSPTIQTIPIETKEKIQIGNIEYETSSVVYKGEIQLSFIMDFPFWYSKNNMLGEEVNGVFSDTWINANGEEELVVNSKDAMKIILEDNIPVYSMIKKTTLLGEHLNFKYNTDSDTIDYIYDGVTLNEDDNTYVYYPGNALCKPNISFKYIPKFMNNGSGTLTAPLIYCPFNSTYSEITNISTIKTNYIELIENKNQYFYITAPSVYNDYNKVLLLFRDTSILTEADMRKKIIETIHHEEIRKLAMHFLNYSSQFTIIVNGEPYEDESANSVLINDVLTSKPISALKRVRMILLMSRIIKRDKVLPIYYQYEGETGRAKAKIGYLTVENYPLSSTVNEEFDNEDETSYLHDEDISDTIQSDFLTIKNRDYLQNGSIKYLNDFHTLHHNFYGDLENFSLSYKYLYY